MEIAKMSKSPKISKILETKKSRSTSLNHKINHRNYQNHKKIMEIVKMSKSPKISKNLETKMSRSTVEITK